MPFTNQYKQFIEKEERISKPFIKPLEIYRISTYKYADGDIKSLAGIKSALVFSIGIYEKKFNCIKMSEIRPDLFFNFMKKLKNKSLTEQKIDEAEFLYDLMIEYGSDRSGKVIYDRYVKNSSQFKILKNQTNPYRTYNLEGLIYVQRVTLKKDSLKSILL
jgi:hypothetical protein